MPQFKVNVSLKVQAPSEDEAKVTAVSAVADADKKEGVSFFSDEIVDSVEELDEDNSDNSEDSEDEEDSEEEVDEEDQD